MEKHGRWGHRGAIMAGSPLDEWSRLDHHRTLKEPPENLVEDGIVENSDRIHQPSLSWNTLKDLDRTLKWARTC